MPDGLWPAERAALKMLKRTEVDGMTRKEAALSVAAHYAKWKRLGPGIAGVLGSGMVVAMVAFGLGNGMPEAAVGGGAFVALGVLGAVTTSYFGARAGEKAALKVVANEKNERTT